MHYHVRREPQQADAGYEVTRSFAGRLDVRIWGKMPYDWIANLSTGVAVAGISIERGAARKLAASEWQANFELIPRESGPVPEEIDYLRLARTGRGTAPGAVLTLDGFSFTEDSLRGALHLEVRASDRTGFLGAFLDRLSFFSLFPEEMTIETRGGKVLDRFWLRGVGGQSPSAAVAAALHRNLEALLAA